MLYFKNLIRCLQDIEITGLKHKMLPLNKTVSKMADLILTQARKGSKVMFIGNGGSASIASHISTDFLKNAKIPSMAFNDSSLITCLSNDLGYEHVFEKPIEMLAKKGDILFAVSSSGKSKNILNAVQKAKARGCFVVTFSGFSKGNPLRKLGDINFYVPSSSYGFVEIIHLVICHCIVEDVIGKNKLHG